MHCLHHCTVGGPRTAGDPLLLLFLTFFVSTTEENGNTFHGLTCQTVQSNVVLNMLWHQNQTGAHQMLWKNPAMADLKTSELKNFQTNVGKKEEEAMAVCAVVVEFQRQC